MVDQLVSRFEKGQSSFKSRVLKVSPPALLTSGYLLLIVLGASLLKLPFSSTKPVTWLEALFTSTSAVTVTGLVVVEHYRKKTKNKRRQKQKGNDK
jgi:trk/ktr system potassium uptake protein